MTCTPTRVLILAAVATLALPSTRLTARSAPEGTKSFYVSVLDESGKPVKDMAPEEFAMREDGRDVQIVSVGPAQAPLMVVFLVDTSDSAVKLTQDIRRGVSAFIKELHTVRNDAAIQLMEFGQAAVATTPFSTDDEVLTKALDRMVGKPTADAVMMEAMQSAANELAKRPSPRRAVVSFNAEPSRELIGDTNRIKDAFRKSVAQFWSVSLQLTDTEFRAGVSPNGRTTAAATMNLGATRNAALTQLAQQTGGQHEMINAPSAIEGLFKQYADALTYQYEIVYKSPNKNAKVVQVGTTRQKVKLHASGFAPQ
jgi:VWFA-related protein